MPETLVIRSDAGLRMGMGHVMRCLALAQGWQEEGRDVLFVQAESLPVVESRLKSEGMQVAQLPEIQPGSQEDALETALLAQKHGARWIIIDGYHFGAAYQKHLKDSGYALLFFDGYGHAEHYYADLILNQNIYATADIYESKETYTQLLLGTSYIMLRREFWPWRNWQREIPEKARNILVTLGGSDPDNITLKVIQALQQIKDDDLQIIAIIGGANPHYSELKVAINAGIKTIRMEKNITNMPKLMAWADLAISAGGGTCWELAFMRVPSLLLVLAENQEKVARYLHQENIAVCLGAGEQATPYSIAGSISSLISNSQLRRDLSLAGANQVDGYGVMRVISSLGKSHSEVIR